MPKFDPSYTPNHLIYKPHNWQVWLRPPPLSMCQIWLESVHWGPFYKYVKCDDFVTFCTFPFLSLFIYSCHRLQQQEAQLPQINCASAANVYLRWQTDRAMHWTPQNRRCCIIFWHSNALIQEVLAKNGFWH